MLSGVFLMAIQKESSVERNVTWVERTWFAVVRIVVRWKGREERGVLRAVS